MVLDVGGRRHKVLESNFNIYPNTRLGKLLTAKTESEILNLCDGYKPGDIPEFFFDRNWHSFNSILDIYRTGVLHLNTDLCALVLQKDLEYWQIDELILGKWDLKVCEKRSIFSTSKRDRQILRQKNCQRISVMEKCFQRIGILIHVLSWRQQKRHCLFSLLRFFDELFDVIINDPFLTL